VRHEAPCRIPGAARVNSEARWGRICAPVPGETFSSWRRRAFLARLAGQAPLLPGSDVLAFIDIDSMQ
jgi:hypothetical protein